MINNFYRIDGLDNQPAFYKIRLVSARKVLGIPDHISGIVEDDIELEAGAAWTEGEFVITSANYGDEAGANAAGTFRTIQLSGYFPGTTPGRTWNFHSMRKERYFVVLVYELNGYVRIVGSPQHPAEFSFSEAAGIVGAPGGTGYNLSFRAVSDKPALYYQASADPVYLPWTLIDCTMNEVLSQAQRLLLLPRREWNNTDPALVSIHAEDAIARQTGNEQDFFTLPCKNFVGMTDADAAAAGITRSTARFTNSKGGMVFDGSDGSIANYVLDHSQRVWDGSRNCLAFYIDIPAYCPTADRLPNCLTACAAMTNLGFNDWFIPNLQQSLAIGYNGSASNAPPLSYAPFNITETFLWTSQVAGGANRAFALVQNGGAAVTVYSSNSRKYIACRKHGY